jgi:hypothetical protein
MQQYNVDGLIFDFPDGWKVSRYDEWSFYRNQFSKMWEGIKAVDILAIDLSRSLWLIEVKDYRTHRRTKPSDLSEEISRKVYDTLAALLPAKANANDSDEKKIAVALVGCQQLRVVLHLEQPRKHSKLFPRAIDPANIQQQIRKLLKPIDAHPRVVEIAAMGSLEWRVS